jgi:hypothetical protein
MPGTCKDHGYYSGSRCTLVVEQCGGSSSSRRSIKDEILDAQEGLLREAVATWIDLQADRAREGLKKKKTPIVDMVLFSICLLVIHYRPFTQGRLLASIVRQDGTRQDAYTIPFRLSDALALLKADN